MRSSIAAGARPRHMPTARALLAAFLLVAPTLAMAGGARAADDLILKVGTDQKLESLFRHFEPFGIGNPTPVLLARNVTIARPPKAVGHDGLKLVLDTGTGSLEALGWGFAPRVAEFQLQPGSRIDVAFRLERDEYRGESYLQARIADLRPTEES